MADEVTTAEAAPEAADATPESVTEAPVAEATPESPALTDEAARKLRSENKSQRERAKAAEKEAADLRAKVDAFEAEKLSETERLQQQAEKAQQAALAAAERAKTANLRAAVAIEATKHGIDADAASKLIADEIEYDAEDIPTNVTDLVDGLVERGVLASKQAVPSSGLPANAEGGSPKQKTHEELLAATQATRFGVDPYENPEALGGGVFMPNGV